MLNNLLPALVAFLLALVLTPVMGTIANRLNIVDRPGGRHQHKQVIPKLGGVGIFFALALTAWLFLPHSAALIQILIVGFLFLLLGVLDDAYDVAPWPRLLGQLAFASVLVLGGVTFTTVGNPFTTAMIPLGGLATAITVTWIVSFVNVINLTDGIDGLVGGLSLISAVILALLSLKTNHLHEAQLAFALAGAVGGFLIYNFHPARIFLGDSGTMFVGYMLAVLGFMGGAKVATAILLLGVPILDGGLIILYRLLSHQPIYQGDRNHLHFRLLDRGWKQPKICLFFYGVSAILGLVALFVSGWHKVIILISLAVVFIGLWVGLWLVEKKTRYR